VIARIEIHEIDPADEWKGATPEDRYMATLYFPDALRQFTITDAFGRTPSEAITALVEKGYLE
jgi:hypothetical protein